MTTIECVDCHTTVEGESDFAFETMRRHTIGAHGREPLRDKAHYRKQRTWGDVYVDVSLLRPELMLAS